VIEKDQFGTQSPVIRTRTLPVHVISVDPEIIGIAFEPEDRRVENLLGNVSSVLDLSKAGSPD
jgi:hypothetical protein